MLSRAITRAFNQILDPAFRRVVLIALAMALGVFVLLFIILQATIPGLVHFGIDWLDEAFGWIFGVTLAPVMLIVAYFFFPAVATMFMSLFLDNIVDAVEDRHYADNKAYRKVPLGENLLMALRMSAVVIAANLIALPIYAILLFTGIGPFVLFFLLNSYLLGREYFEMVAVRHFPAYDARRLWRAKRDKAFLGGAAITTAFLVPFVNLLGPLIGAAVMVHIFHDILDRGKTA